jgi:hypothetical protein
MRAVLGDSADSSRGEKLRANNQMSANRCVGRLLHIGLGRARLTGLFEFGLVVDGGDEGKRRHLYPAHLVWAPRWRSGRCDAQIARSSGSDDMSGTAVSRNGLGSRILAIAQSR